MDKQRIKKRAKLAAAQKPGREGSVVTISQYGPDDKTITKVVAAFAPPKAGPTHTRKWVGENVHNDPGAIAEIWQFVCACKPETVVHTTGVFGCPHEEGVDYPNGRTCPQCSFWLGRDRYATAKPVIYYFDDYKDRNPLKPS